MCFSSSVILSSCMTTFTIQLLYIFTKSAPPQTKKTLHALYYIQNVLPYLFLICNVWCVSSSVILISCMAKCTIQLRYIHKSTVRAPVFGRLRHQFFGTSEHYGKAHESLLSGWRNYNYTACCWFPTSSNISILPSQFSQIRFQSYWLHWSKCRILVLLRHPSPNKENLACLVSYSKFDIILIFCFLILYAGCVLSSVILSSSLAWQILHVMCIIYIHKSVPPQTKTVSHVCYRVQSFLYIRFPFIAQMCDVHEVQLFLALLCHILHMMCIIYSQNYPSPKTVLHACFHVQNFLNSLSIYNTNVWYLKRFLSIHNKEFVLPCELSPTVCCRLRRTGVDSL